MFEWIRSHDVILWWLASASVVMFLGTLIAVPVLVARIPPDYFVHRSRRRVPWDDQHPIIRVILLGMKNAFGALFVVVGISMLVLPGQGVLTVVIGLMLLDFPGKFALERWLVSRRTVGRVIGWLRRRAGRPPLQLPGERASDDDRR
jgi:hypothetical protein